MDADEKGLRLHADTASSRSRRPDLCFAQRRPTRSVSSICIEVYELTRLALDLLTQLLRFSPHDRIDVVEALTHPYVGTYHDEGDEPVCHDVFDKWEQVEGLETIEELREAITREIEEYRAEVRNIIIESDESGEEELDIENYEILDEEQTITVSPSRQLDYQGSPTVPPPNPASSSPIISQKELGYGLSPKSTMHQLPAISRSRSRGRGTTPQSPALEESSAMVGGHPISRSSSRRTSGYSMQGRRPASFLFSPFGNGMTPMPSNITLMNGAGAGVGYNNLNAISSSTGSSAGGPGHLLGPGPVHGHGHSASMEFYNGRRSRAPSSTGEFSLGPLIRQLSTVGMGVGGDEGVPVPGQESSHAGGLDGLPPPPIYTGTGTGGGGGDDGFLDTGLPPMNVSPSDAPPSTVSPIRITIHTLDK